MGKGLVLFDIDGTLLHAPGAGRAAFATAFKEAFGWEQSVEHVNFYGATDLNVFRGICVERGVESTPDMERAFFERLAPALETRLAACPPVLFPNVGNILREVSRDWKLGLVTGNIEATAWAKLRYAGIDQYFSFGGFGCTHADRAEIARQALKISGVEHPKKVFLIGDTPSDINAAKINGFTAIAVATGGFDFQALEKAGADFVLRDLTDTERLLSILER
ncbi:MAG: HAD family hydrolase [Verrucomicrobia bacterium]|nr:HAD family hydrolase [Verrucomicrobiota bacterium]